MYEDDGVSDLHLKGYYLLSTIDYNYLPNNYTVIIRPIEGKSGIVPDKRNYKIRFRNTRLPEKVSVAINDKVTEDFDYYADDNDLVIEIKHVDTKKQLSINCSGKDIEIDAVKVINEDINEIISDLKIETLLKERLASIIFGDLPINKKRIAVKKLSKAGLNELFIKMFIKLLEYIEEI